MDEKIKKGIVKKFLYVNRRAPYGTVYALESLDVALIASAFNQDVSLAFFDDGVYQLSKNMNTKKIDQKNFSLTYGALSDYGITKIYVSVESLCVRGLTKDDLIDLKYKNEQGIEKKSIHFVTTQALSDLMDTQDVILSF